MFPISMTIIIILALAAFAYTAVGRVGLLLKMRGTREFRWGSLTERFKGLLTFAFGQKRLLFRDGKSGLMHAFIFWGFLVIAIRTVTLFGCAFYADFDFPFLGGPVGVIYEFTKNIFEALVLVGVTALLARRIFWRPKRLTLSLEANLILVAIGVLMLTDFFIEGADVGGKWFTANYFIHTVGILAFLNYLPYGKHFHIITAIPNVFLRKTSPKGALKSINLEDEKATTFGVEKIGEFNWKQALDLFSCTECGRCQDECPAYNTDKKLSPKELTIALRNHLYKNASALNKARPGDVLNATAPLVPETIDPDVLWDCTTCRACEEACPVFIEYVDKIVDMRRNLVLMKGDFAPEAQTALRNIENNSNPWGIGFSTRGDWAKDLGVKTLAEDKNVEYLYFVGCAGSFDERAKKVSRAFVKCLQTAGVSFGILGAEEKCTGDSARRIGNEYLFQTLAKENIATFDRYGVKKIITTCPHCFNTLKNEFPEFGGNYEVVHHTELLRDLIAEGKLKPAPSRDCAAITFRHREEPEGRRGDPVKSMSYTGLLRHFVPRNDVATQSPMHGKTITFHDSCYLGRYNDIYDAPREILKSLPGVRIEEPKLAKDTGRCCGAGGGRMWMEEKRGTRINHKRLEDLKTRDTPKLIASACPFCLTMLGDAVKETNTQGMEVKDIAELVAETI